MEDIKELHDKVEGCMLAVRLCACDRTTKVLVQNMPTFKPALSLDWAQAGESTGCEVEVQWQGDHKIFGHEDYKLASRTYADVITNSVRVFSCSPHEHTDS